MNKIPKVVHLYWSGEKLSYLHFLTLLSLNKTNPDFDIVVHTSTSNGGTPWTTFEQKEKYTGKDYWPEVSKLPYVIIDEVDFEERMGIPNTTSDVHKSDFLRLHILATEGGIWSDFDILYLKPFVKSGLSFTNCHPNEIDTLIGFDGVNFPIGLLMSAPNNEYFKYALEVARRTFNPAHYQCIGSCMFMGSVKNIDGILKTFPSIKLATLGMNTFYAINFNCLHKIFDPKHRSEGIEALKPTSVGIHWYNGHPNAKRACNMYIEDNVPDCLVTDLMKDIGVF